ncbi:phage integrase family protein [Corynebacterium simulans]|uniref:site-specific integrase n=1 Tax=Corynebacterium simulans TaxID=146827 RepID=UPI00078453A7|nr:site-specific integrase [Corynebacterium simulans]AMO87803.1 phage integrase family protein [Corynebacterium simulans]
MTSNYTAADFEAIIANYTPQAVREEHWSQVADFTRDCVRALDIKPESTSRDTLRMTLNVVAKLSAWVWVSYGVVSVETVFHPDIIGNYFLTGAGAKLSPSTAGTQRSLLYRVGEALNDDWNPDFQHPITYEPALKPYDRYATDRLWDWALSQPTAARRRNFLTVLSLTLGAGLRAGEICTLKGQDVRVDQDGVLVFPHGYRGAGPREVPLLKTHIESLQAVINSTAPDDYLFRPGRDNEHVGQLSAYLRRVTPSTSPEMVPDTRRLRNTWIVDRILAGVPADVLCAAAGLKSLHQFEDYVVEAGANRRHAYRMLLAGGSTNGPIVGGLHVL